MTKEFKFPETIDIRDVEVMSVGTHNRVPFTMKDLEDMVNTFRETKGALKPFLKLGHNKAQERTDGKPAIGLIENLRKVGSKLVADFSNVPKKLGQLIKAKSFSRVSIEAFLNFKLGDKIFPRALRAIAILGADTPAVRNLEDIVALFSDEDTGNKDEYQSFEVDLNKQEDVTMEKEIAKLKEEISALKVELDVEKKKSAEFEKKFNEEKTAKEAAAGDLETVKQEGLKKEVTSFVDKKIEEGHIEPAKKEFFISIFTELKNSEVKKFKQGDKEVGMEDLLVEYIDSHKVDLKTKEDTHSKTGYTDSDEELHNKAIQFQEEKKAKGIEVSYKEALIEVSPADTSSDE